MLATRLARFNLRRFLERVVAYFRRSLQARWVAATIVLTTVALVSVGGFLSYSIGAGLFDTKLQQALKDAERATVEVQNTFTATTASDLVSLQTLMNTVVPSLESANANDSRLVALLRSPGQTESQYLQSPVSLDLDLAVIPADLRNEVRNYDSKLLYKSVDLTVKGASHPGLIVGSKITIPVAGDYELYLVYDLLGAQQTLDFVQSTLVVGGLILILLIGAVSYYVTARLVRPVKVAAEVASELAAQNLEPRIKVSGTDVIADLGRSFNIMADRMQTKIGELSALSRMQQRFVADVSHELRTPLTTIKLSAALLADKKDELSPSAKKNLEKLETQVGRFEELLNDLLEISRYDAGTVVPEFEVEDLNGAVGIALMNIQVLADAKGCELKVSIPGGQVLAEFDPRRIERVLRNLLANATEHGAGKPIEVAVGQNESAVAVTITDHGVGMTQAESRQVFDRFWRADRARNKQGSGGTGLGMSIALADAQIHQGWLQVVSKPNRGTTFRLTLPRSQSVMFTQSPLPLTLPESSGE